MASTWDRHESIAEFQDGEPIPGAVADRSVEMEARPAPADGPPQGFLVATVGGPSRSRPHHGAGGPSGDPARSAGAAREPAPLAKAAERPPAVEAPKVRRGAAAGMRTGPVLVLWAILIVDLQGLLWLSGAKALALRQAVEQGAARIESRAVAETGDNQIRKAIRDQRASLRFWTILALLGDFVVEPTAPAVRAILAATLLSALAALAGRPTGFRTALEESAVAQGYWVLALALQATLVFALGTPEVDASIALLLPAGTYRATTWAALSQVEMLAVLGWIALIRGGWRRGQVNLATATAACSALAAFEAAVRIGSTVVAGAMMRLATPGRF